MIPLVMHYNGDYTDCAVYKLEDYTEELAQEHGIHDEDPDADFTLDTLEEAADAAGELHSEWDFETEDSEGTDSGEESGTDQNTENSENGTSESENTDSGINEQ